MTKLKQFLITGLMFFIEGRTIHRLGEFSASQEPGPRASFTEVRRGNMEAEHDGLGGLDFLRR